MKNDLKTELGSGVLIGDMTTSLAVDLTGDSVTDETSESDFKGDSGSGVFSGDDIELRSSSWFRCGDDTSICIGSSSGLESKLSTFAEVAGGLKSLPKFASSSNVKNDLTVDGSWTSNSCSTFVSPSTGRCRLSSSSGLTGELRSSTTP